MATPLRRRFVYSQMALMLGSVFVLLLFDALTLGTFFVLSFVDFLVLLELSTPMNLTPTWQARLRWLVLLGLLGMGYVVLQRFLSLVPSVVF